VVMPLEHGEDFVGLPLGRVELVVQAEQGAIVRVVRVGQVELVWQVVPTALVVRVVPAETVEPTAPAAEHVVQVALDPEVEATDPVDQVALDSQDKEEAQSAADAVAQAAGEVEQLEAAAGLRP